jgi:hypothetical protein
LAARGEDPLFTLKANVCSKTDLRHPPSAGVVTQSRRIDSRPISLTLMFLMTCFMDYYLLLKHTCFRQYSFNLRHHNQGVQIRRKFSPNGNCLLYAVSLKLQNYVDQMLRFLLPAKEKLWINFDKNGFGYFLGGFFYKLIWSPCSQPWSWGRFRESRIFSSSTSDRPFHLAADKVRVTRFGQFSHIGSLFTLLFLIACVEC